MCNKENNHRHQHYGRAETVMDDGHIQRPYSEVQTRVNVLRAVFFWEPQPKFEVLEYVHQMSQLTSDE